MLQEIHITSQDYEPWKIRIKHVEAFEFDLVILMLYSQYMEKVTQEQRLSFLKLLDSVTKGMRSIYDL